MAGINTQKYKSHSTRGASVSAAKRLGVPVSLILKQASWKEALSFPRFYDKDIENDTAQVAQTLLENAV